MKQTLFLSLSLFLFLFLFSLNFSHAGLKEKEGLDLRACENSLKSALISVSRIDLNRYLKHDPLTEDRAIIRTDDSRSYLTFAQGLIKGALALEGKYVKTYSILVLKFIDDIISDSIEAKYSMNLYNREMSSLVFKILEIYNQNANKADSFEDETDSVLRILALLGYENFLYKQIFSSSPSLFGFID